MRTYLFGVIAFVAAVPVIVLGAVQAQRWVTVESARTDRATLALSRSLAGRLSLEMTGHLKSIEVLAEQLRGHLDNDGLAAVAHAHAVSHPEDTGIAVVDPSGAALFNVSAGGSVAPRIGVSYANRPYFRRVLATRRAFISPQVIMGRVTGVPNVHAVAPVLDSAGEVTAVAIASIDLDPIGAAARAVASGVDDGRVVVVDARGRVIADSDDLEPRLRDVSGSALFAPTAAGRNSPAGANSAAGGTITDGRRGPARWRSSSPISAGASWRCARRPRSSGTARWSAARPPRSPCWRWWPR